MGQDYIHSYASAEQLRLLRQAEFLRPWLYPGGPVAAGGEDSGIRLHDGEEVLEIGCGVGAQLKILLEHPGARLTGVDRSLAQLATARELLAPELAQGRVSLLPSQAEALPCPDDHFDQAFIFFVLEHGNQPVAILKEARRVLKPGGRLTVTEVHNGSLFVDPLCPAVESFWAAYNCLQVDLGGDPHVGIKLPNLALRAGFELEHWREIGPVMDARLPESQRSAVVEFWLGLFASVQGRLVEEGRISADIVDRVGAELRALVTNPDAVLFYAGRQLTARKRR